MKKISIIGTNGIPAKYGGFETLVEHLVMNLASQYEITVFCSSITCDKTLKSYKGCTLRYIPLRANGWQSILFDFVSIIRSLNFDKIIILGASGGIFMPLLYKYSDKFILNFGGMDWQRSKWSILTRYFLKISEQFSISFSDHLISDNQGIKEYIYGRYHRDSFLIAYGGDQAVFQKYNNEDIKKYSFISGDYAITVARIQPDNNISMILNAFRKNKSVQIVMIGNWESSNYGKSIKNKYSRFENIFLLDAIYNQRELDLLRSNCKVYIHGHSAGGTNPALVEAMRLGLPILAYDNNFNRYTTFGEALYFSDSNELRKLLTEKYYKKYKKSGDAMLKLGKEHYSWSLIADKYAQVIEGSNV